MITDCSPEELWDLPAANAAFLTDVSLLEDTAQYPSCDGGSIGSAVLVNTTLNTATVAYYTGTTPGSTACFVCDEGSGYNTTTTAERVCQSNARWSGSPIICGTLSTTSNLNCTYFICVGASLIEPHTSMMLL